MTDTLIHTVIDCEPERVSSLDAAPRYKLHNYLFDTEEQARDYIASRPYARLTYCAQWWSYPWSFDNFLHTDYRKGA